LSARHFPGADVGSVGFGKAPSRPRAAHKVSGNESNSQNRFTSWANKCAWQAYRRNLSAQPNKLIHPKHAWAARRQHIRTASPAGEVRRTLSPDPP
jgi:hypothetical protein